MGEKRLPHWLQWAREIQALSQNGLSYSESHYNLQRFQRLTEIAAEILKRQTKLKKGQIFEDFKLQTGYATPKVDVRGAVIRDKKILLVQERSDNHWCMPGGWADVGVPPSEMVKREVWEESGFNVTVRKVIGLYDANTSGIPLEFYHAYKIVFLCKIIGGQAHPSDETMAVDFFTFEDLPPLSIERTNRKHLMEVMAHLESPNRSTAFD